MTGYLIRVLGPADFDEFCRLRLGSLRLHPVAYASMPEDFEKAPRQQKLEMLLESERPSGNFILGCFEGAMLVGLVGFRREARESVRHKGSLWGLYVEPELRRQGIGRALLEAAMEHLKLRPDLRYVRAIIPHCATDALALADAVGGERYGLETEGISDGQAFYDQVYVKLPLHR